MNPGYKASFRRRSLAALTDFIIFSILTVVIFYILMNSQLRLGAGGYGALLTLVVLGPISALIIYLTISTLISSLLLWRFSKSIGKKLFSLYVLNNSYNRPTFFQSLIRESLGKWIIYLTLGLGFISSFWDQKSQALDDKLAGTLVFTTIPTDKRSFSDYIAIVLIPIFIGFLVLSTCWRLYISLYKLPRKLDFLNEDINRKTIEFLGRSNDTASKTALDFLNEDIKRYLELSKNPNLCFGVSAPCDSFAQGSSQQKKDGTGWVKINFIQADPHTPPLLPNDPDPNDPYYYRYCSDGKDWELNTVFRTSEFNKYAEKDGGDNPLVYEVGSNLKLCPAK